MHIHDAFIIEVYDQSENERINALPVHTDACAAAHCNMSKVVNTNYYHILQQQQ